jgi:hypothetical protein
MTEPSRLSIVALVSDCERPAVDLGAAHIARAMSEAAGAPWAIDVSYASGWEELRRSTGARIILTSLLRELGASGETWPQAAQRLRTDYGALAEGGVPIFVCTILRHVARTEEPVSDSALRLHIRRLNLLATEISRESRAYVIDIDRVLADIGARSLQTDHRLVGPSAVEFAAHYMAVTLIGNAFDDVVSYEIQDSAKAVLAACRPTIARLDAKKAAVTLSIPLRAVGMGRQQQVVVPALSTVPRDSGTLIGQVLRGSIKPGAAYRRLVKAVRSHGVRKSAALIAIGLSKQFKRKR